jgi:hypothetical protein
VAVAAAISTSESVIKEEDINPTGRCRTTSSNARILCFWLRPKQNENHNQSKQKGQGRGEWEGTHGRCVEQDDFDTVYALLHLFVLNSLLFSFEMPEKGKNGERWRRRRHSGAALPTYYIYNDILTNDLTNMINWKIS